MINKIILTNNNKRIFFKKTKQKLKMKYEITIETVT